MFTQVHVDIVENSAQSPAPSSLIFLTKSIRRTLSAISDKPKVFALLPPDILNCDHFWVSFEAISITRKWPFYERAFPKQQLCQQITIPLIN
jgi:hypothetical protein